MDHTLNFSETAILGGTLYLLACFSVLTWSVIVLKAGELLWHRYRLNQLMPQINLNELIAGGAEQSQPQGKHRVTHPTIRS